MPFQRHRFQALGHVGLVHAIQMHRRGTLLDELIDRAPEVGTRRVGQVWHWVAQLARQRIQRSTLGIGLHIRREQLAAQRQHVVMFGVKLDRLTGVVVGNQQIATAFHKAQHRIVNIERNQPTFDRTIGFAQA